jgi:hypothetical protein
VRPVPEAYEDGRTRGLKRLSTSTRFDLIAPRPGRFSLTAMIVLYIVDALMALALIGIIVKPPADANVNLIDIPIILFLLGWLTVQESLKRRVIRRGEPKARGLWAQGLFCDHCSFVSVNGQAFSPIDFRQFVWDTGGYGRYVRSRRAAAARYRSRA